LTKYIEQQAAKNIALAPISILFDPPNTAQIGLVLTERLVNIPSEVVPPMYKMLLEEMTWAVEEKEPYTFSHYLILSKTYLEVASTLDVEEGPQPEKKKKKGKSGKGVSAKNSGGEVFYFHPEDEVLHRHAIAFGDYAYDNEHKDGQSDAKRTFQEFGIKPQGHMILIEAAKFEGAVKALEDFIRPP
jgi:protein BCP1